jgi:hypothetical protein
MISDLNLIVARTVEPFHDALGKRHRWSEACSGATATQPEAMIPSGFAVAIGEGRKGFGIACIV